MAPLEDLERDYSMIDSNFRMFCASHGIFTDEDFLVHDLYALESIAGRGYAPEKLKHGIKQVLSIIESRHRPWLNGLELLEDAQLNKCTLSTGCERIDVLLQGGLREGHVIELVGPSSSCKTQVCLRAASHVAGNYLGKVIYFDTGNSFSPKRVVQFLSLSSDPSTTEVNKTVQRVMSSIVCHSVFDIFTLLNMLHRLMNDLKSQIDCQVKMLIIDSLASLIAPVLGGGGTQGYICSLVSVRLWEIDNSTTLNRVISPFHLNWYAAVAPKLFASWVICTGHALMVTAGFLLKELAHEYNISVVVTNHMVAGEAGISKPALGESWKSIPHVRLLLSRNYSSNGSCITILKHPCLATGKSTDFVVM